MALAAKVVGVAGGSCVSAHNASAEGVRMSFMSPSTTPLLGDHSEYDRPPRSRAMTDGTAEMLYAGVLPADWQSTYGEPRLEW